MPVDNFRSDVSNADWNQIFRSYTTEELIAHRDSLKSQITIFSQQSIGSKSFTRDLKELRDQLSSAVFVLAERSRPAGQNLGVGITDFSQIQ